MKRYWQFVWEADFGNFITNTNQGVVERLREILKDDSIVVRSGSFTKTDPGKFVFEGKTGFVWQIHD